MPFHVPGLAIAHEGLHDLAFWVFQTWGWNVGLASQRAVLVLGIAWCGGCILYSFLSCNTHGVLYAGCGYGDCTHCLLGFQALISSLQSPGYIFVCHCLHGPSDQRYYSGSWILLVMAIISIIVFLGLHLVNYSSKYWSLSCGLDLSSTYGHYNRYHRDN